jgi:hypothetical protein
MILEVDLVDEVVVEAVTEVAVDGKSHIKRFRIRFLECVNP